VRSSYHAREMVEAGVDVTEQDDAILDPLRPAAS
jgi:hypothetical protein